MRKIGYLVVEGPHDVAFSIRLLKSIFDVQEVKNFKELEDAVRVLVPNVFPHDNDLLKRVPVPTFLQNKDVCIAVHAAGGEDAIPETVGDTLGALEGENVYSVGAILDTDSKKSAEVRSSDLVSAFLELDIDFPHAAGDVSMGPLKKGYYILPDNKNKGTLEDLLLESGEVQYKFLLDAARVYIDSIDGLCTGPEYKEFRKPAGKNKALIGAVASVLKPGKAIQNSIQDNRWFKEDALSIKSIADASKFLSQLFDFKD